MKRLITFPIIFALLAAICTMGIANAGGWKKSYQAGTFDKNLKYMGGTELVFLENHKGKLMQEQVCRQTYRYGDCKWQEIKLIGEFGIRNTSQYIVSQELEMKVHTSCQKQEQSYNINRCRI